MRTRIERNVESAWNEIRRWSLRHFQVSRRHLLLWKARLLQLVQRGRSAVSIAGAGEQEAYEALESIVAVDEGARGEDSGGSASGTTPAGATVSTRPGQ